jgi:hypothetical protein
LLVRDPRQRLGCRPVETNGRSSSSAGPSTCLPCGEDEKAVEESYLELKSHRFFEGVPWGHFFNCTPPFVPLITNEQISEVMHDGNNDDWMLEGEATPIQREFRADEIATKAEGKFEIVRLETAKPSPTSVKMRWLPFLHEGESQVFTGLVSKRVVRELCRS